MAADIRSVSPSTAAADHTAGELRAAVEDFILAHGASLAGFALVTWDLNGAVKTALAAQRGVGEAVSLVHRVVSLIAFGGLPLFGTIVPGRKHDKLFHGREIATVIERSNQQTVESKVLFYAPAAVLADAKASLTENVGPPT